MTSVTLTRGATSVTFEVYEQSGNLLVTRDAGKPEARLYRTGRDDPRTSDHRAPLEAFTVVGQLVGADAHADALALVDIVKTHSDGVDAVLDLSDVSGLSTYIVGFPSNRALALGYPPGQPDWVSLQLTAVVVDNTIG